MSDKEEWFRDELERQRKCQKYIKWIRNVSLYLLGFLSGMIIQSLYLESQASFKLLIITIGWCFEVILFEDWAFRIKLKIKRMEEMID